MKMRILILSVLTAAGIGALLVHGVNASGPERHERDHASSTEQERHQERYEDRHEHEYGDRLETRGKILPLQAVIGKATERHPGRVWESKLERESNRYVYEIELRDEQGRKWELSYDAVTGEMLREQRDD